MAKKIRLTERNLQQLVRRVIKESQLLNENMIEIDCECSDDCECTGSFDGATMHCECCATECKDESPDDGKFGGGGRPMAMADRMREAYYRGFKVGRKKRR
tara:strand:- start:1379 stop:1681 length:303 start_codon:yes stop_codon:yes gene_type:complete